MKDVYMALLACRSSGHGVEVHKLAGWVDLPEEEVREEKPSVINIYPTSTKNDITTKISLKTPRETNKQQNNSSHTIFKKKY
jgi:hypothetical protein